MDVTGGHGGGRYHESMFTVERLIRNRGGLEVANSTVDQPLEHLVACHGRIEERLAILERAGAVLDTHTAEALDAVQGCFRYFDTSGIMHTADEEESTFPRLRPRLTPEQIGEIERLERDHRIADEMYERLKAVTTRLRAGVTPESVEEYRGIVRQFTAHYRAHIEFENTRLIAVCRENLAPEELQAISTEMKRRRGLIRD
ncbi:MAG TPA: hemerythrin domain-containing protein [Bryobacteraceae bacterium]|nr:hemerythrin domain-containing protein [Bryobacteraceae bacterium]